MFLCLVIPKCKKTSIHIRNKSSVSQLLLMSYTSGTRYDRTNYANRSFGSKPVETGKEYNVQITYRSRRGDGIARIRGFVIFVKGGRIGQDVKAKVTSVGERFAKAEIVV
jgi:predicted RNA-binding protein with TRAM domain